MEPLDAGLRLGRGDAQVEHAVEQLAGRADDLGPGELVSSPKRRCPLYGTWSASTTAISTVNSNPAPASFEARTRMATVSTRRAA